MITKVPYLVMATSYFPIENCMKEFYKVVTVYSTPVKVQELFICPSEQPKYLSLLSKEWRRCEILKIH